MKKQKRNAKNSLTWIMKLSLTQVLLSVIFTTFCLASPKAQDILDRKVTLHLENVALRNALTQLENQANIQFGYSSKAIKVQRRVTITASNQRLADILNDVLKPMRISYRVVNDQIILTNINATETTPLSMSSINIKNDTSANCYGYHQRRKRRRYSQRQCHC